MSANEEFWTHRREHEKRVAAKLREVLDEIANGEEDDLYRDGLSKNLGTVQQNCLYLSDQLDPAVPAQPPQSVPLIPSSGNGE